MSEWDVDTQTDQAEAVDVDDAAIRRNRAYLIVITGTGVGTMHKLPEGEVVIGRSQRAQVKLLDDGVSRAHAKIRVAGQLLQLEDLGSRNGTYVNGRPVEGAVTLGDGDKIQIGRTTVLKFSYHDSLDETFHSQMLESALRDGTTKLFNKRYFLERLDGEIKFSRRHQSALSLLMVDIDHFKQVNDRFGHVAGDLVLANTAAAIQRSVRNEDVVARFGGEEIAIILRAIDITHAVILGERLRRMIEALVTRHEADVIRATVSIGVAGTPDADFDNVVEFVQAADQALYRAKNAGRNRVAT